MTFPDFEKEPVYTDDGRPFTRSDRDNCPHYKAVELEAQSIECNDCCWFRQEDTPRDLIGVCVCDALRCEPGKETSKEEPV